MLLESCLSIKIDNIDDYFTTTKKKLEFLNSENAIEQKINGIKISLFYINNTGDYTKDWIVSYNNNIIYHSEFEYTSLNYAKTNSIGGAQFRLIFEHLKELKPIDIEIGTEFFIEYLISKPSLMSNYKNKHKMILLAYSKTDYEIKFGKIYSCPRSYKTAKRDKYADILKLDTPRSLFFGTFDTLENFENGILDKELKTKFQQIKNILNPLNPEDYYFKIKELFLSISSKYGGEEEGVVVTNEAGIFKIVNDTKDIAAISKIRQKFRGSDEEEQDYQKRIRAESLSIVNLLPQPFLESKINNILSEVGLILRKRKIDIKHTKKSDLQIKDDIFFYIKKIIIKNLKGNNNILYINKFDIFTTKHYNIIKDSLKNYDKIIICIVSDKNNINTKNLRAKIIKSCFKDDRIEIIFTNFAGIKYVLSKTDTNINSVLCSADRYRNYEEQLKDLPDIRIEIYDNKSLVTTKSLLNNIDNKILFLRNTPKEIHDYYDEIVKTVKYYKKEK